MKIVYEPRDGDRREWTWKPRELDSLEAEDLEEVTDWPYQLFVSKYLAGSTRAGRALLWVLLKREHPALQFEQVRYRMDELWDDYDDDELAAMRASLDEPSDDPVDQAARERFREILAVRDRQHADAVEDFATDLAGASPGKDTAEPAEPASST